MCRFRSLGCTPCTGAIESSASTLEAIVEEMFGFRISERAGRIIDYDTDGSMELKKREGYF
jgi:sulfate adenylyltransferase subunit 2